MAITLVTSSQKTINIEDQHFASGGEGKIHKITSPAAYKNYCVKLYESKYCTPERQNKLTFLIQNTPAHLQNNDYMVCFPKELVFINKQFVGFIMPLAFKDSIQLEALCTTGIRPIYKQHAKFARHLPDAFQKRLQLCLNLAVPVHLVHSLNKYVFVDIKPPNILVSPDAKISIIDIDSIQISANTQVIHSAQVNTPDYSPPEWWNVKRGKYIPESWDRFAIAVIFYQILFGIHPYTASFKQPYANITEIPELIKNGLFVHGHNNYAIAVLPPPHQLFRQLDSRLQGLFIGAFEVGLYAPDKRPTLDQWGQTFFDVIQSKSPIKNPSPPPINNSTIIQPNKPAFNYQPSITSISSAQVATTTYAGFWKRLFAILIDIIVLFVISIIVGIIMLATGTIQSELESNLNVIVFFGQWLYFAIMESSSSQATFGKKALGIKVTDLQGNRISFGNATGRYFGKFISFIILGTGYLMVAFTEKKQGLHDKMAGCLVVNK